MKISQTELDKLVNLYKLTGSINEVAEIDCSDVPDDKAVRDAVLESGYELETVEQFKQDYPHLLPKPDTTYLIQSCSPLYFGRMEVDFIHKREDYVQLFLTLTKWAREGDFFTIWEAE